MIRPDLEAKYQARLLPPDETGCIRWLNPSTNGYGYMAHGGRNYAAHRYTVEREHGPIPEGHEPDHLCTNRECQNPGHLEVVPQPENARRGQLLRHGHIPLWVPGVRDANLRVVAAELHYEAINRAQKTDQANRALGWSEHYLDLADQQRQRLQDAGQAVDHRLVSSLISKYRENRTGRPAS